MNESGFIPSIVGYHIAAGIVTAVVVVVVVTVVDTWSTVYIKSKYSSGSYTHMLRWLSPPTGKQHRNETARQYACNKCFNRCGCLDWIEVSLTCHICGCHYPIVRVHIPYSNMFNIEIR